MTIEELKKKGFKILPYTSVEEAFLHFVEEYKKFEKEPHKGTVFHNGREDSVTSLKPRELFCLAVIANVANYLSGDIWVPGALMKSDGTAPPSDIAHDGFIQCAEGAGKGKFMWFEQVMATDKAKNSKPNDIEAAILFEANRKSSKGSDYGVEETALIVFCDYNGELKDLRKLSIDISKVSYKVIYLVAVTSKNIKDCVCIILKSPGDTLGPIKVQFNYPNGKADVKRFS